MRAPLTQFTITGLHGKKNFDVPIRDNKLVLVGENGTGKSTVASLIYFFLTRQWRRLRESRFQAIRVTLGSEKIEVTPEKLEEHFSRRTQAETLLMRHGTIFMRRRMRRWIDEYTYEDILRSPQVLFSMSEEVGIHPDRLRDLLANEASEKPSALQLIGKKITSLVSDQFLYLPTYRRIEQDLQSIFRGADLETEVRKLREGLSAGSTSSHYIELVQFGMGDVENTILKRMTQIKESVRTGLNNLIGAYLKDVIRGTHTTVDVAKVQTIDQNTLDSMFARIDEVTLPKQDKELLRNKIADITTTHHIEKDDQFIAHFLFKLAELYSEQEADERNVRDFVKVCNEYLWGKELIYDKAKYTVYINISPDLGEQLQMSPEQLELKSLSSGEKQIVSLFSHIYLSGQKSFFMVIDEPELSLSVPWQRRFLPDILKSGLCAGLIAVTHSPFVWENELEQYVRSLAEFAEPHHVLR